MGILLVKAHRGVNDVSTKYEYVQTAQRQIQQTKTPLLAEEGFSYLRG